MKGKINNGKKINKNKLVINLAIIVVIICSILIIANKVHRHYTNHNKSLNVTSEKNDKSKKKGDSSNEVVIGKDLLENPDIKDRDPNEKVAYLTFDDGPNPSTTEGILDILNRYNIHGTFFTLGYNVERYPDLVKKEIENGETIANHTYSHDYKYLYENTDNFVADVEKWEKTIKKIIPDFKSKKLIRFPGGSFSHEIQKQAITNKGYSFVDWNALVGDAETQHASVEYLQKRIQETTHDQRTLVVLMHDAPGKESTVEVLPYVIEFLQSKGYVFDTY